MVKESEFQASCVKRLKQEFPNAIVYKNDSKRGFPDLMVLNGDRWATLECKRSKRAKHQPLQDMYVDKMNSMSYSSFLYPENEDEVFLELHRHFG